MRGDISSSVVRIPNTEYGFTEYGKRNYIFLMGIYVDINL